MSADNLIKLTEALNSAGYEITSYVEERDTFFRVMINLKITPLCEDEKKDGD